MITRHNQQRDAADNVLQFRRDLRAPLCAQCHIPMALMRAVPDIKEPRALRVTYRCAGCGLIEQFSETGRE
jgi:RNase P subunit RPR2